jgi:presenilin 1
MKHIYAIIQPVLACIFLSVIWVKLSLKSEFKPVQSSYSVYHEQDSDGAGERFTGSLLNALIVVGQIIVATVVFVVLFKFKCWKVRSFLLTFIHPD